MLQNNKSLGQHWLKDRTILDEIASEAMVVFDDPEAEQPVCVEIGPGLGTLTSSLLRCFPKVIAVEFDERLAKNLPKSFPGKNLEVVNADILKFDFATVSDSFVVAGNIPYYITSPIIMKLLALERKPARIALLIQKEVAERILAGPGEHSVLSLSVQNAARVSAGVDVPREYFTPPPKVDSATIILEPFETPVYPEETLRLAKLGFSSPRKKLVKNLAGASFGGVVKSREEILKIFVKLGISENARPANLSLEDWDKLRQTY